MAGTDTGLQCMRMVWGELAVPAPFLPVLNRLCSFVFKKNPSPGIKGKNLILVTRRTSWLFFLLFQSHPDAFFFFSLMFWEGLWVLLGREHCSCSHQTQAHSGMGYVGSVQLMQVTKQQEAVTNLQAHAFHRCSASLHVPSTQGTSWEQLG